MWALTYWNNNGIDGALSKCVSLLVCVLVHVCIRWLSLWLGCFCGSSTKLCLQGTHLLWQQLRCTFLALLKERCVCTFFFLKAFLFQQVSAERRVFISEQSNVYLVVFMFYISLVYAGKPIFLLMSTKSHAPAPQPTGDAATRCVCVIVGGRQGLGESKWD